ARRCHSRLSQGRLQTRAASSVGWAVATEPPTLSSRTRRDNFRDNRPEAKKEGRMVDGKVYKTGGGRGIRTPDTLSGTTVFKTAAINHSAIPPQAEIQITRLPGWPG